MLADYVLKKSTIISLNITAGLLIHIHQFRNPLFIFIQDRVKMAKLESAVKPQHCMYEFIISSYFDN